MIHNIFGTDGIRATVGTQPFTREHLAHLGTAIARWAHTRYGAAARIALAHDTRASCHFVKAALQSGLLSYSLTIFDMQILPTPALCYLVQRTPDFDCGIIISASHNPYQDNGIKIITRDGKINHDDELLISQFFYEQSEITYHTLGTTVMLPEALHTYCTAITQLFETNFLHGKKIVLDCANGATSIVAPTIFKQLGASIVVIHNEPDGLNINKQCGALHLNDLQQAVITHQADIGFAFDGDGDRIIAVNRHGVIKNGDDILALLLDHPFYRASKAVVGTIMTNHGLASFLADRNITLIRTNVGDKYVLEQLIKENLPLGGEQSGHIILRDYLDTGDGVFTALRIAETMILTSNWEMNTFTKYPQILINLPVARKKDLQQPPLAGIIAQGNAQLHSGRLVIRYSGTEHLLRIMIEDKALENAQQIGTFLSEALHKELSTV